ncbi:AP2/ERF family transcription factor [Lactiplantibacillus herbarum]|uniref:AP2/ERF family transcription factor n=1 Tax=Lactiplantibacillus herbarum TaxID=1670446 RepID=UPI00064F2C99|nr:AP2/ERF family transcription factor [Lactiplantibacillus herbarum]
MSVMIDLTGQTFNRLTVIERGGTSKNGNALWRCQCSCGNQTVVDSYALRHGKIRSCGCLSRELSAVNIRKNPKTLASMGHTSNFQIHDHHTDIPSQVLSKRNKSGVIGVSWDKNAQRWVAHFYYKGVYLLNKQYIHFEDAVAARRAIERQYLKQQPVLSE